MERFFAILCSVFVVLSAFGQGQVVFNNRDLITPILAPISLGAPISDFQARAALLGGPTNAVPASLGPAHWSRGTLQMLASPTTGATWVNFQTGPLAGFVDVGNDSIREVPGIRAGEPAMLQIVAWTGNYPDWQSAFSAAINPPYDMLYLGCSEPWIVTTAQTAADPNFPVNVGMKPFDLLVFALPEPSPATLTCLGVILFALRLRMR